MLVRIGREEGYEGFALQYWAMLTDMAGPLAPLIAGLAASERDRVLREVTDGIAPFRVGDVFRIPAQAQLAWAVV